MSLATFVSKAEEQVGNGGITYTTWFGVPESTAWCAIFVSWCANEADILTTEATASPPDVYKTAGVDVMRQWYNDNHRAFVISSSPTSSNYPKPGDIVTVATGSDPTAHTHVAIVVATDGNKITTPFLGSNQQDRPSAPPKPPHQRQHHRHIHPFLLGNRPPDICGRLPLCLYRSIF